MTAAASRAPVLSGEVPQTDVQDIDDFIYLMSHDVRASVRALIELPHWIAEDLVEAGVEVSPSVAQSIDMMNRHTARLDRMLVDLLAYSRVGRLQDMVRIDVNAALDEVLAGLHMPEGMTRIRDIGCSHVIMGEQDMGTLWSALIGNAVKHHHAKQGRIFVRTQREGSMVRLSVSDDGLGIPERLHAKALSAMTTLRPRDDVEGTGMGLANVRKMAEHYGGSLELSNIAAVAGGLKVDMLIPHGCDTPV